MPRTKKRSSSSKSGKMAMVKEAPIKALRSVAMAPQKLKKVATRPGTAQTVAKGAAGIAIAATAIAAGAALTSKTYRKSIMQGAEKAFDTLKEISSDMGEQNQERFQAIQHTVGKKTSSKKGKKAKK